MSLKYDENIDSEFLESDLQQSIDYESKMNYKYMRIFQDKFIKADQHLRFVISVLEDILEIGNLEDAKGLAKYALSYNQK